MVYRYCIANCFFKDNYSFNILACRSQEWSMVLKKNHLNKAVYFRPIYITMVLRVFHYQVFAYYAN